MDRMYGKTIRIIRQNQQINRIAFTKYYSKYVRTCDVWCTMQTERNEFESLFLKNKKKSEPDKMKERQIDVEGQGENHEEINKGKENKIFEKMEKSYL